MAVLIRREQPRIEVPGWVTRFLDEGLGDGGWFDKADRMLMEEFVEDGVLVIRVEIPGVDPEKDVDVDVHDGVLHIQAQRTEKQETTEKSFYRSEFRYGSFSRHVPLPAGATPDDIKATYADGVLEVRVPTNSQTAKATKVPVQRTG